MNISKKKKLKIFIMLILLATVATVINVIFSYKNSIDNAKTNNLINTRIIAKNARNYIQNHINKNEISSRIISNLNFGNVDLRNIDIKSFEILYAAKVINSDFDNDFVDNMGLINADGKIIYSVKENFDNDKKIKEIVKSINNSGQRYVSNIIPAFNNTYELYILSPVMSKDKIVVGYVYRSININILYMDIVYDYDNLQNANFLFIDNKGEIIYSDLVDVTGKVLDDEIYHSKEDTISKIKTDEEFSNIIKFKYNIKNEKNNKYLLSSTPIKINGKQIMSTAMLVPINSVTYYMEDYLVNQVIIVIMFILALIYATYDSYRTFIEYEKQKSYYMAKIEDEEKIKKLNTEVNNMQYNIIKSMVKLIEMKDSYTAGHSERVTEYSVGFAKYLKLPKEEIKTIKYAAILHDMGKVGIDENILNKPNKLTDAEFQIIKKHPVLGYEALKDIEFLHKEVNAVRHHHERIDGKGYPDGIDGNGICLYSKILTLADSFDAMTSNRVYRKKLSFIDALDEIKKNSGTQFDNDLAGRFIDYIKSNYSSELN